MNTSEITEKTQQKTPWFRTKWSGDLAVFLAVCIWFGFFSWFDVDLHHDGIMLAAADLVAQKRVIFREVFCQYGPLVVWIQSIPVSLFGAEVLVIRLTTVLFYGFIALLGAKIWERFLDKPFRLIWYVCFFTLSPFYSTTFHPWTSVYALFFMLLGVEMQLRFFEEREVPQHPALWAGACAAAAFLCRTPCGVVTFSAGTAVFLLHTACEEGPGKFRGIKAYVGGAGGIMLLFAAYLIAADAWQDYIRQCFTFISHFAFQQAGAGFFTKFVSAVFSPQDPWGVCIHIFLIFPLLVAWMLFCEGKKLLGWKRDEVRKQLPFLAVLFMTAASLHQYFPVVCERHMWWSAIPAFGVYALAIQKIWNWKAPLKWRTIVLLFLVLPWLNAFYHRIYTAGKKIENMSQMTVADLPGMRYSLVPRDDCKFFSSLYSAYKCLPPEIRQRGVINHTPDGSFSVLFPPPPKFYHPMFVNWYDQVYPDYTFTVSVLAEEKRPVILSTMLEKIPNYRVVFRGRRFDKNFYLFAPLF